MALPTMCHECKYCIQVGSNHECHRYPPVAASYYDAPNMWAYPVIKDPMQSCCGDAEKIVGE